MSHANEKSSSLLLQNTWSKYIFFELVSNFIVLVNRSKKGGLSPSLLALKLLGLS